MKHILFEATPYNPTTSSTITIRMSSASGSSDAALLDGYEWKPCITGSPNSVYRWFNSGVLQNMEMDHGELTFICHQNFDNLNWSNLGWEGATASAWVGEHGAPFASYTKFFSGLLGPVSRDGAIAKMKLLGAESLIELRPLLTSKYAGTGDAEGLASAKGNLKPVAYGYCQNVEPVLVDPARQIYQFHDGAANDVVQVYENAIAISGGPIATVPTTYAALKALSVPEGQWAKAPAIGMFKLGSEPSGKLTADVQGAKDGATYVSTINTIVPALLKVAGVVSGSIDTSSMAWTSSYNWCFYSKEQVNVSEVARSAVRHAGGYLYADSNGVWKTTNFYGSYSVQTVNIDRSVDPLVKSITKVKTGLPYYNIRVAANRCWSVHSRTEISDKLLVLSEDVEAAQADADAAQATADTAAANATTALNRLNDIVNDGILDRSEKPWVVHEFGQINAEKAYNNSTASGLGITTENTNYNTSFTTLQNYLNGLSPAYTDYTTNTPIVRTTFLANWQDLYTKRGILLSKIAEVAATRATWSGVTGAGRPADNAGTTLSLIKANTDRTTITGNTITVTSSGGGTWDSTIYSNESFNGAAFITCSANSTSNGPLVGLATPANKSTTGFAACNFGLYFWGSGNVYYNESGANNSLATGVTAADIFSITYDGGNVKYWRNGSVIRTVAASAGLTLHPKVVTDVGGSVTNLQFGAYTDNAWGSVIGAGRPADYATVGANLITNSSFATNIDGYTIFAGGVRTAASAGDPAPFIRATNTSGGVTYTNNIPVGTGQIKIYYCYWQRQSNVADYTALQFNCLSAAGAYLGGGGGPWFGNVGYPLGVGDTKSACAANTWVLVTGSADLPIGTTTLSSITLQGVPSSGHTVDVTGLVLSLTELNVNRNTKISTMDVGAGRGDNLVINGDFGDGLNAWQIAAVDQPYLSVVTSPSTAPSKMAARMTGNRGINVAINPSTNSGSTIPVIGDSLIYVTGFARASAALIPMYVQAYFINAAGGYGGTGTVTGVWYLSSPNTTGQFVDFTIKAPSNAVSMVMSVSFGLNGKTSSDWAEWTALRVSYTKMGATNDSQLYDTGFINVVQKPNFIQQDTERLNRFTALTARLTALGITSHATLTTATTAKNDYLTWRNGLSPAWNDTTQASPIVAATLNTKISDFLSGMDSLDALISAEDAARANWSGVTGTGRPADFADVTVNQPIVSMLDPVTGRVTNPTHYNTQALLGPDSVTNLSPSYTVGGSNVTVNLPSHTRKIAGPSGPVTLSYGAMSGVVAFSTYWTAYVDDPTLSGIASPTATFTSNADDLLYAGRYQVSSGFTPAAGGTGGGVGGGGGGGGGWDGCVEASSFMPTGGIAGDVKAGDMILVLDYDDTNKTKLTAVTYNKIVPAVCFELTSASGIQCIISDSTPCTLKDGSTVLPDKVLGLELAVQDDDGFRWEEIVQVDDVGPRFVAHISCNEGTYAAGKVEGRYIFTHNVVHKP